jgi:hypothetical protein
MSLGDEHGYGGEPGGGRGDESFGGTGQTRTRLPDGDPDAYGPPRRPARSSRSLIAVVGVVVLLIAAIALANRGGGADDPSGDGSKAAGGTQPTAATGVKPVTGKNGANAAIPSGYAKTEQGAQSAAANYAVALGSDGMFKASTRRGIVEAVYDPAAADTLVADLDKAYSAGFLANVGLSADGAAPTGLTFISRTVPVGTKVTAQNGDTATVEVWCTGVVGLAGPESTKPVTDTWFTITQKLKWIGDDWKIESSSQKEGPTPVNGDNRASSADEIAGAVQGYGGFTYAR